VPTPFYHLSIAQSILTQDIRLSNSQSILKHYGAFILGNTAPDVQIVSRQSRQDTHFFRLPLDRHAQYPWEVMFERYPQLENLREINSEQVAFLLGYMCHLQADFLWVQTIFHPLFGPQLDWGSFPERLYLHNVLRAYLDAQILPTLDSVLIAQMQAVIPNRWLPFIKDDHLIIWRDYLYEQLIPGAASRTVEVFASRQGLPTDDFNQLLSSESRMETEIFSRVPRSQLATYYHLIISQNQELIESYIKKLAMNSSSTIENQEHASSVIGRHP
jgi:hypothetical protein